MPPTHGDGEPSRAHFTEEESWRDLMGLRLVNKGGAPGDRAPATSPGGPAGERGAGLGTYNPAAPGRELEVGGQLDVGAQQREQTQQEVHDL